MHQFLLHYYNVLKHGHLLLVAISVLLFHIRYFRRVINPQQPLSDLERFLRDSIDSLLFLTGILLALALKASPFGADGWLGQKLIFLALYIGLGIALLHTHPRRATGIVLYILACLCLVVIYLSAKLKNSFLFLPSLL